MKSFFCVGLLALIMVVFGISCSKSSGNVAQNGSASSNNSSTGKVENLTKEQVDKLKRGMTRPEVESVIGPGKVDPLMDEKGFSYVVKWTDRQNDYVVITSQEGKLFKISSDIRD
jgi:outer membrane protein assembly factor BamE (lipoprotein component of BamABCDE complex)